MGDHHGLKGDQVKRTLVVLAGMVFAAIYANQAFAAIDPANAGWIQVCKQSAAAPNAVIGNFRFEIKDTVGSDIFVNVPVGLCSGPIQVGAGTVIGSVQAPIATGGVVNVKPLLPVTVNVNVPVSPEPVTICLQTSIVPGSSVLVKVTVTALL